MAPSLVINKDLLIYLLPDEYRYYRSSMELGLGYDGYCDVPIVVLVSVLWECYSCSVVKLTGLYTLQLNHYGSRAR